MVAGERKRCDDIKLLCEQEAFGENRPPHSSHMRNVAIWLAACLTQIYTDSLHVPCEFSAKTEKSHYPFSIYREIELFNALYDPREL